jgi:hypothetical protein
MKEKKRKEKGEIIAAKRENANTGHWGHWGHWGRVGPGIDTAI